MSDIPTDAFHEIIRRIPVESLFQLRSVCKSWRKTIDDPDFAKLLFSRGNGAEGWILHRSTRGKLFLLPLSRLIHLQNSSTSNVECTHATKIKPPLGFHTSYIRDLPLPNCNGLVLICHSSKIYAWLIWNPFTSESVKLPLCDEFSNDVNNPPCSGIGYDDATDDYKVVRIANGCTFVFSLNSGAWRRVQDLPNDVGGRPGAFANGALHWIVGPKYISDLQGIVAFDLTTETYQSITLPLDIPESRCPLELVALGGCLFLFTTSMKREFFMWMWTIKDDGDDDKIWTRMMSVMEDSDGSFNPIAYMKNENRVLFQQEHDKFAWYDVEKQHLSKVSMKVNPDANDNILEYIRSTFRSQVIPASLIRLKKNEVVASGGRKGKWGDVEKLSLQVCHDPAMIND